MKRWLRIAVSLTLLVTAVWLLDVHAMARTLRSLSVHGVAAALLTTLLVFGVLAARWLLIVQPLVPKPMHEHLRHYFLATFLNTFTPANIGGDAYRIVSLRSSDEGSSPAIIAVVRERVLGLLSYLLAAPLLALAVSLYSLNTQSRLSSAIELAVLAATSGAAALLLAPLVTRRFGGLAFVQKRPWLRHVLSAVDLGLRFPSWGSFSVLLALSILGVVLWITAVAFVAADLGMGIAWPELGLVVVITELLRMLPTTIQGVGMREAAFAYFVGELGGSPEHGFVLGGISYLILTVALAVCGAIGAALMHVGRRT